MKLLKNNWISICCVIFIIIMLCGVIFALMYNYDVIHFGDDISSYMDVEYENKNRLIVDYDGRNYYPSMYETASLTNVLTRGDRITRSRLFFKDENDYDYSDQLVANYGDTVISLYKLSNYEDTCLMKYESAKGWTHYYMVSHLEIFSNVINELRLIEE